MASSRDAARLRQGLNPLLTTALGPFSNPSSAQQQQQHQHQHQGPQPTPISAVSMTSSHFLASSVQTPLQPYNPQEWANSPVTMPERYFSPAGDSSAVGASAGAPLPPPPYSPPRSQQAQHQPQQRPMSTAFEHFSNSSTPPPPLPRLPSGSNYHRPSPEQTTSFPPPPGLVGRGASRERRFLSSLTRRREATDSNAASSPDMRQTPPAPLRINSGAASIHTPEPYRPASMVFEGQSGPPSARRAASTGAIETPTSAQSRSTSQTRWEPGMPVPPPPPGPPPASSRSSSVQPMDQNQVPIISPPTRRPPPSSGSALGPVPPTPAGWIDSDSAADPVGRGRSPALKIDTEAAEQHGTAYDPNPSSSSANSLSRQKAVRHDKTIMQRRAESRSRHSARSSIDERTLSSNPENIVIPTEGEDGPARLLITKLTPKTGDSLNSHNSTPRASSKQPMTEAATPPFSPYQPKLAQRSAPIMGGSSVPKSLPTPPPQARSASGSRPREASRPPSRQPSRPPSAAASIPRHLVLSQSADQFAAAAIERFQSFAAREALAESDADKVRLFTDFFVHESMIRRERYNAAIGAMGSEIFDLTRDLFQPLKSDRRQSAVSADEWTPATTTDASASHRGSVSSFHGDNGGPSNSEPTSAGVALSPTGPAAGTGTWASNYMPSLSPILSMSVSDNHENGSSRGRPPSRWFESTSQGETARGFTRSKRESKYMGVPKEQWEESFTEGNDSHTATSERASSVDYPPEKSGLHEEMESAIQPQPAQTLDDSVVLGSPPQRPDGRQLDVSRLVTMPPPYPRHHPALNNSHPELTAIRTSVRALSNVAELDSTREMFDFESSRRRDEFAKSSSERQKALRANLQDEISSGNIGYSDAAAIEADARTEEHNKKKELEKSEYEQFQSKVILPMNELLSNRISRATDLFEDLSRKLFDNGQNDADMPQEEGDDRPELLEKLTLLKWIFEARETLHKATFDILSDRNSRYRDVVLLPYQLSGNNEKLKSAEAFFAEDAAKREYAYAHEVLNRVREFRGVVEEAVGHGVAMQLSAFWDIAPPLSQVLESIPQDLSDFLVQIPPSEYEENPAYRDHPLQYLFSLLLHAEKSTYQFIESHTNLLCLLHEVKEAVVHAKARVLATQVEDAEGASICTEEREKRARSMRKTEERKLTEDLKEKVRVVQDQWRSGLGDAIVGVKARTGQWLLQTGGWDEALEDGGVGGA